jgi:acyl-CoA synthetase (AMP-forming)/AMP-acid ligase II
MAGFLTPFLMRAATDPDRVLFTLDVGGNLTPCTHATLLHGARRHAGIFLAAGALPGQTLLISLRPGADLYHAFLGALLLGCIPSMMPFPSAKQDPALFWDSHNRLFAHLGGGIIITDSDYVDAIRDNSPNGLMTILTPAYQAEIYDGPNHAWSSDDICCLQHSSGTTGLKKGVTLTHDAIEQQIDSYRRAIQIEADDTIVSWLPLYHDMGFVTTTLLPLVLGNHTVVMSPFEWLSRPTALFDLIERFDGKFAWLPNFAFKHLARSVQDEHPRDLSRVKAFINCSEPCKPQTFDAFLERFSSWGVRPDQLQVCYAMAETVFAVTQTALGTPVTRLTISSSSLAEPASLSFDGPNLVCVLSAGRPVDGIQVRIDGAEIGEILVRGRFVFRGYYRVDSGDCFSDGWYRTGDIGFYWQGELFVLGRKTDLIIVLGKNFFAHELEELVNSVPGVNPGRAVALGVYSAELGSEDVAIVAEPHPGADRRGVRLAVRKVLEGTLGLVPRHIMLVEPGWLVKSTSGKISRKENLRKYNAMVHR